MEWVLFFVILSSVAIKLLGQQVDVARADARAMSMEDLVDAIEWAQGFGDSSSIYHDELARRQVRL
jgi:hypothetical protein